MIDSDAFGYYFSFKFPFMVYFKDLYKRISIKDFLGLIEIAYKLKGKQGTSILEYFSDIISD